MKTIIFRFFLFLLLFFFRQGFSQETEILRVLNRAFLEDLKIKPEYNHFGDTLKIVIPFSIKDGILSVEIEHTGPSHYIEKQEVQISKIKAIKKDINVIFDTEGNEDVRKTITGIVDGKHSKSITETYNLFFTGIRVQKQNKDLAGSLKKAFSKAGYILEIGGWYD